MRAFCRVVTFALCANRRFTKIAEQESVYATNRYLTIIHIIQQDGYGRGGIQAGREQGTRQGRAPVVEHVTHQHAAQSTRPPIVILMIPEIVPDSV